MCRLPRQICLFLTVVTLAVATQQTRRPLHLDSRPLQDHEQLQLSDPDTRLLSYYLNTRRNGIADLLSDESPEELDQPPHEHEHAAVSPSPYDLAYLYQQLDLVTAIRDLISGTQTSEQKGLGLSRDSLAAEDFPRSTHPTSEPQDYDIVELFEKMREDNNMGARQRRAANTAQEQPGRQGAEEIFTLKNGKEEVNPEELCRPGSDDWPTCRFLKDFKFKVEKFRIKPLDDKKEDETRKEEKKVEAGSVRMYGDDEKDEGSKDDDTRMKSGSRRKREANNVEVWKDPLEGVGGKRVPDFHSWGGKRASQVDLDEIYHSDSSAIGDKRAPEFNSWGGKRSLGFSDLGGRINDESNFRGRKRMLAYTNNLEGKRGPSFNSWGGKRTPSFNSWGGKRTPSFNSWGGKRTTSFNSWGGKRAPSFNSWGGKRAPEFNSWGGKRAPEFNSWGGKRAPEFNSWGGKRAPEFNSWGGKRAPEFNSWGGKRNPAFNSWGGKRSSRSLQKLLGNTDMAATNDDLFSERGLESVKTKVAKRGSMDGIRTLIKAPNLPVIRSRAAGFYPWGGKRSDTSFLQE